MIKTSDESECSNDDENANDDDDFGFGDKEGPQSELMYEGPCISQSLL